MKSHLLAAGLSVGLHLILGLALSLLRHQPEIVPWQGPPVLTMCQLVDQAPEAINAPAPPAIATKSDEQSSPANELQPPQTVKAVLKEPLRAPVAQPKKPAQPKKEGRVAKARLEKPLVTVPALQPVAPPEIDSLPGTSSVHEQGTAATTLAIPANSTPATENKSSSAPSIPASIVGQGLEIKPVYKETPEPPYPALAKRMGYQGTVELKVLVNRSGTVEELQVVSSSGYQVLDHSALTAVQRWSFKPGTRDAVQEAMWIKIPVQFKLR